MLTAIHKDGELVAYVLGDTIYHRDGGHTICEDEVDARQTAESYYGAYGVRQARIEVERILFRNLRVDHENLS